MKRAVIALIAGVAMVPMAASAETWKNAALVDVMCSTKAKANPDAHTKACALQCQNSGFGIITADGEFLTFDSAGNQKAIEVLKSSKQNDKLRVTVSGERSGDTIKVLSVTL